MESEEISLVSPSRLNINYDKCLSCAACPSVCHAMALRMSGLTLELDRNLCDNCSSCIHVCPTGALYIGETALPESGSKACR